MRSFSLEGQLPETLQIMDWVEELWGLYQTVLPHNHRSLLTSTELSGPQILPALAFPLNVFSLLFCVFVIVVVVFFLERQLYRPWLMVLWVSSHLKPNITSNYPVCLVELGRGFNSLLKASVTLETLATGRRWEKKESSALWLSQEFFPPLHLKIPQWHVTICHLKLQITDLHSKKGFSRWQYNIS